MAQKSQNMLLSNKGVETTIYKVMRRPRKQNNKTKVLITMLIAVIFCSLGDVMLSKGMKMIGRTEFRSMYYAFLAAISNIYIISGILLMIGFFLLYLASLSWEDLSFVLPLTAAEYILVTLFAYIILKEDISALRWVGSISVAAGIALVART